jgi:hypothetical protein
MDVAEEILGTMQMIQGNSEGYWKKSLEHDATF